MRVLVLLAPMFLASAVAQGNGNSSNSVSNNGGGNGPATAAGSAGASSPSPSGGSNSTNSGTNVNSNSTNTNTGNSTVGGSANNSSSGGVKTTAKPIGYENPDPVPPSTLVPIKAGAQRADVALTLAAAGVGAAIAAGLTLAM
ncbi:hypothetical protein CspHIS471_0407780 [Cutaneotrichosporon sp. HIS471]|nr:hypothetical protein CspHIS471_0407780 [Cutaneotrichosporon sp. HIS471]